MENMILGLLERFIEELIIDNPQLDDVLSNIDVKQSMNNVVDEMIDVLDDYTTNLD